MKTFPKSICVRNFPYNLPRNKAFKPFKAFKRKAGNDDESGRR